MMPLNDILLSGRRFSAALLRSSAIASLADVRAVLGDRISATGETATARHDAWRVLRFEYLSETCLYPSAVVSEESQSRGAFYAHEAIVGFNASVEEGQVILAFPYVRLLRQAVDLIQTSADLPPRFLQFNVERLFDALQSNPSGLRAGRLVTRVTDDPGVARVVISGNAPLRSKTWEQVRGLASPFGLRIDRDVSTAAPWVFVDQVGRLHWHQSTPKSLPVILEILGLVRGLGDAFREELDWASPADDSDESDS
jgi:hypothetical protein